MILASLLFLPEYSKHSKRFPLAYQEISVFECCLCTLISIRRFRFEFSTCLKEFFYYGWLKGKHNHWNVAEIWITMKSSMNYQQISNGIHKENLYWCFWVGFCRAFAQFVDYSFWYLHEFIVVIEPIWGIKRNSLLTWPFTSRRWFLSP